MRKNAMGKNAVNKISGLRAATWLAGAWVFVVVSTVSWADQARVSAAAETSAEYKRGKLLYIQCRACHDVKPSPIEKVGPNLAGLMNRPAGQDPDFAYSPALVRSKLVWDRATLDRWLARPGELIPGNTMAFAGVANPADRAALIAYLEVETRTP